MAYLKLLGSYAADAFLLDSCVKGKSGGTGVKFDWALAVKAKKFGKPVILAGGLDAGNVGAAINKVKPYAVDACSRLEAAPGRKDHGLVKRFIKKAKNTN